MRAGNVPSPLSPAEGGGDARTPRAVALRPGADLTGFRLAVRAPRRPGCPARGGDMVGDRFARPVRRLVGAGPRRAAGPAETGGRPDPAGGPAPRSGALRPALRVDLAGLPRRAAPAGGRQRSAGPPPAPDGESDPARPAQDARLSALPSIGGPPTANTSSPGSSRITSSWRPPRRSSSTASAACAGRS